MEDINNMKVALVAKTEKLDREFELQYNKYI